MVKHFLKFLASEEKAAAPTDYKKSQSKLRI